MSVVQTSAGLLSLTPGWLPASSSSSLTLYDNFTLDYWTIYRTQSNVKTVVDFIARNIAQLGLHVFQRVSDTDRQRQADHPLDQLGGVLPPSMTRFRQIRRLVRDLCVQGNALWLKLRRPDGGLAVLPVPWPIVSVTGQLVPVGYRVGIRGLEDLTPEQVVHFREDGDLLGLSPLESLRRVLAEEVAATDYREGFWRNSARMSGIIKRPSAAPEWSTAARERFRAEFEALYTGGQNSGRTAILEEDMDWVPNTFSAEDSEYLASRKLTREEVARAFHVPLPMVGLLDNATFSNITEQHKNLYQDSFGPWLTMIEQDLELQLLPEFGDTTGLYLEFNIAEKLKGSFEEQASALSTLVGRPVMSANEGRARLNLPSMGGDADELVTPLNVIVGGQPSPQTPTGANAPKALAAPTVKAVDPTHARLRARHVAKWTQALAHFFERQREVVVGRLPKNRKAAAADLFNASRWNRELAADVLPLSTATATVFAKQVADELGIDYDPDIMLPWLKENARITAEGVNKITLAKLAAALEEDDPLEAIQTLFDTAAGSRAAQIAQTKVTSVANFGAHDAADHSGLRTKTWLTISSRPRASHARLAGETVPMSADFSNGMKWPGDPNGGADEVANCTCSVTFA